MFKSTNWHSMPSHNQHHCHQHQPQSYSMHQKDFFNTANQSPLEQHHHETKWHHSWMHSAVTAAVHHIAPRHAARHQQQHNLHTHNHSIGIIGGEITNNNSLVLNQLATGTGVGAIPSSISSVADSAGESSFSSAALVTMVQSELSQMATTNLNSSISLSPELATNSSNFGMRSYESYQELELLNSTWQAALIILYTATAIGALAGNLAVIWVLIKGKRSSKELRHFLVNLAMADITMAVFSIPFTYTGIHTKETFKSQSKYITFELL